MIKKDDSFPEIVPQRKQNDLMNSALKQECIDKESLQMMESLMKHIGVALEQWAKQYGMEKLPPRIIFKKALSLMNLWEKISKNYDD